MKLFYTLVSLIGILSTSMCKTQEDSYSFDFESFYFEYFDFGSYSFETDYQIESPSYENTESPESTNKDFFTFSPTPSGYSTEWPTTGPTSGPTAGPTSFQSDGIEFNPRGIEEITEQVNSSKSIVPSVFMIAPFIVLVGLFC